MTRSFPAVVDVGNFELAFDYPPRLAATMALGLESKKTKNNTMNADITTPCIAACHVTS